MDTNSLLDMFGAPGSGGGSAAGAPGGAGGGSNGAAAGAAGGGGRKGGAMARALEVMGELWEGEQYEKEFDVGSFMAKLAPGSNQEQGQL